MSYSARIRDLFKRYGKIGVAVHLGIYGATFAGCYYAASSNMQFEEFLTRHGLLGTHEVKDSGDPERQGAITGWLAKGGSSVALAFICTKALLPIRVPLTLALTPAVARAIRGPAASVGQKQGL